VGGPAKLLFDLSHSHRFGECNQYLPVPVASLSKLWLTDAVHRSDWQAWSPVVSRDSAQPIAGLSHEYIVHFWEQVDFLYQQSRDHGTS